MLSGLIHTNPDTYEWNVGYKFYMLTKLELWKNNVNSSGFEVTFSAWPPEEFDGWPDETFMFG